MNKRRKPTCPKCLSVGLYNESMDAYMCRPCNHWLENVCEDKECRYCNKRPASPVDVNDTPLDGFAQMA